MKAPRRVVLRFLVGDTRDSGIGSREEYTNALHLESNCGTLECDLLLLKWVTWEAAEMQLDVLAVLCCPGNRSALSPASESVVNQINVAVHERRLSNLAGRVLEQPIDGGLIRADGTLLYPIIDGIPVLLHDDAIPLHQLGGNSRG